MSEINATKAFIKMLVAILKTLSNKTNIFNMAEQEVIKHTKKVFKILEDKNSSFWHKFKDFVLEIFIIVFAISISIWFQNWSERRNEQKTTKTFLLGLKDDIQADITETEDILKTYKEYNLLYTYLNSLDRKKTPSKDSLKKALTYIGSNTFLRAHESRFNGFLSAGKIMSIENDSLTQNILNYFQVVLPSLQTSEEIWLSQNRLLITYLTDNVKDFENDMDKFQVLTTAKGKYLTKSLIPWQQLLDRYKLVSFEGNKIILNINKLYPKNK